jgi:alkylation response protein AidB-like acyl-CoA dehydrogenase
MAWHYTAPLREMRFVIEQVLKAPASWSACAAFADLDIETTEAILEEAARFASEKLLPINASGDAQGCVLEAGQVRTPDGYREAYRAFVEGGWPALPCDPAWGGQGLPLLVDAALREMLVACNHAWTMYPDLLHGAYETIKAHASDELKDRYLRRIASGECLAAMALTEPQAGSDLGQLTTRATPQADGSLRITGSKIFISGADHDLTDNIVHLVLCRLPDAPPGSKGISLALVPKILPDGTRNAWQVDSLEHKLGIHGSATCALRYEGATGWLIGEANRGLAAMFLMMNSARLHVGLQGLGHQEMATQNALTYAAERVQMKQPIDQHPAVRHTLPRRLSAPRASGPARRAVHAGDQSLLHPPRLSFGQCGLAGFRRLRLCAGIRHRANPARCAHRDGL